MIHKKTLLVLLLSALTSFHVMAELQPDYESGKAKVATIMSNTETGIAAYNKKNIHCTETLNIAHDVNTNKIAEFFGCKTLIGRSFFEETLNSPLSPQDRDTILANRQKAIRALVENPALKKQVEELLEQAKQEEQEVVILMSDFFMGRNCPELKALEQIKEQNPGLYPLFESMVTSRSFKNVSLGLSAFGAVFSIVATGACAKNAYLHTKLGLNYTLPAFYTAYLGLVSGITLYGLHKDYALGSEKRIKMHALNQLIMIASQCEALTQDYAIQTQFKLSNVQDQQGLNLVHELKHKRYEAKRSIFFQTPAVHVFLYKIYQEQKHLAEVFACIAEMDAYNAVATKIIEAQNTSNKFCFVNFVENTKPSIQSNNFWNVLVNNAIPNSLTENRHVILTGPNAGGKTTTIRALLQNIILGQSFGVAAAESFECTMFDVIHSYLNVSDDLINGLSLFASEVKRAQEILQKIKSLENGKKFFFALDELFTGTVSEDGEHCAYEFVKRISTLNGVQFIYATHFDKLKELGNNSNVCTNYKVDAPTKNELGKLVYPFTLSQGANQARVAIDIAKEAKLFE